VRAVHDTWDALGAVLAAALGYALADLLSGVVHWACDRFGTPDTPLVGPRLIAPFREHHVDPQALVQHDFAELCGSSFLGVAPLWAVSWLVVGEQSAAWQAFALALGLATGLTNAVHRLAHRTDPPRLAAWLQARGLILSPAEHARHHAPPFATHYCVTTGWWNRALERTRALERLEAALARRARKGTGAPAYREDARPGIDRDSI